MLVNKASSDFTSFNPPFLRPPPDKTSSRSTEFNCIVAKYQPIICRIPSWNVVRVNPLSMVRFAREQINEIVLTLRSVQQSDRSAFARFAKNRM